MRLHIIRQKRSAKTGRVRQLGKRMDESVNLTMAATIAQSSFPNPRMIFKRTQRRREANTRLTTRQTATNAWTEAVRVSFAAFGSPTTSEFIRDGPMRFTWWFVAGSSDGQKQYAMSGNRRWKQE
jgi:hypothetical protein